MLFTFYKSYLFFIRNVFQIFLFTAFPHFHFCAFYISHFFSFLHKKCINFLKILSGLGSNLVYAMLRNLVQRQSSKNVRIETDLGNS